MLVRPLNPIDNFQLLKQEIETIIQDVGFEKNQIICQSLEDNADQWHSGIGSISELEEKDEKKYCKIHTSLKGTYLEQLISQHNGYRTRIMLMPPRQCYSIHSDHSYRIHIPIVTNDQCWMIWPRDSACYRLFPEMSYLTNTTKPHTFINGGLENRIHVVMCV